MKLKKLIALGLSVIMLLSLAACGEKNNEAKVESNETVATAPSENVTENQTQDKETQEEKIAYYEKYAESEDFGFVGESIEVVTDMMEMSMLAAEDNTGIFSTKMGESEIVLYQDKDGKMYVYVSMTDEEGNHQEGWYNFVSEDDETGDISEVGMSSATDDYSINKDTIVKTEYVESKDGVDYVKAEMKNENYIEGETTVQYEISFKYEDQDCTMVVTRTKTEYSDGCAYDEGDLPEGFNMSDYEIDFDNKTLTNENGTVIEYTVDKETDMSQKEILEAILAIDAKTKKIVSVEQEVGGVSAVTTFTNLETCSDRVTVGEIVGDCDAMSFMMYYLGILFMGADM